MHAISQEPQPCIYAQLEPCGSISQDEESGEEEELYPEIRFIPSDANKCEFLIVYLPQDSRATAGTDFDTLSHVQCRTFLKIYVNAQPSILIQLMKVELHAPAG